MSDQFYPSSWTKCTTMKGENIIFLNFVAGGTETEVKQGECLCQLKDGTTRRFHLEELRKREK